MTQRVPLTAEHAKNLFLERAAAYYDKLNAAAENAPYGQTFHHAETFVANEGRELIRSSLESIMQVKIDELQKEGDDALSEMPNKKTTPRLPNEKQIKRRRSRNP